jgi:hypothetical protein
MVNELAAHGFIQDEDYYIHEEIVQGMRTLTFHNSDISVSVAKVGDTKALKGYWDGSKIDRDDRDMIVEKLRAVMHYQALLPPLNPSVTASPESAKRSDDSRLRGTTLTASENENEKELSGSSSSGKDTSLEESGLVKFVKVHYKQNKGIADHLHAIRAHACLYSNIRATGASEDAAAKEIEDRFKVVVIWANKEERQDGVNLLERMIAERLGDHRKKTYMKGVLVREEIMDDGEMWLVFRKKEVVVGFPGRFGDEEFLESVRDMEKVWS